MWLRLFCISVPNFTETAQSGPIVPAFCLALWQNMRHVCGAEVFPGVSLYNAISSLLVSPLCGSPLLRSRKPHYPTDDVSEFRQSDVDLAVPVIGIT